MAVNELARFQTDPQRVSLLAFRARALRVEPSRRHESRGQAPDADYIMANMPDAPYFEEHPALVRYAVEQVRTEGLYLEFVVESGVRYEYIVFPVTGQHHASLMRGCRGQLQSTCAMGPVLHPGDQRVREAGREHHRAGRFR